MRRVRDEGVERVYDYLLQHHYGAENGIKRSELAETLGVSVRYLRRATAQINANEMFDKLVSTTNSCYICKTESECRHALKATWAQAITLIKKARKMGKKFQNNGQEKISLGKEDYRLFVETFTE